MAEPTYHTKGVDTKQVAIIATLFYQPPKRVFIQIACYVKEGVICTP
jgi:hypothetical protein